VRFIRVPIFPSQLLEATFAELFREEACNKEGILHGHISYSGISSNT
jgi:hypothetical protein